MTGTLWELALAVIAFVGSHVVLGSTPLRGAIVGAVGANAFRGIFSLVALVTLVWVIFAYRAAPTVELFDPGTGMKHISLTAMIVACLFVTTGYSRRNPTMFNATREAAVQSSGIIAVTRHPLMWAIAIWGVVHMAANGDAASWLLFGGMVVLAMGGAALLDRKKKAELGAAWEGLAARTSFVPFVALISRRAHVTLGEIGWIRLAAGLVLYAVLLWAHPLVIGVSPLSF
jgi:uncharacterized membrane protein